MNHDPSSIDLIVEQNLLAQAMLDATSIMASLTEPEEVLYTLCDVLSRASRHFLLGWVHCVGDNCPPDYLKGAAAQRVKALDLPPSSQPGMQEALRQWEVVSADHEQGGPLHREGLCSAISMPVGQKGGAPCGIVTIHANLPGYFDLVGTALFAAFLHLANASLTQTLMMRELNHLATHDQLTGLLNRRGVQEALDREFARCRRRCKPFSIILFDLDRFKLVNDRLGHQEGDIVLHKVAEQAEKLVRQEDYLGRWGGEEFICLATETPRRDALQLAERMRLSIRETPLTTSLGLIPVTASFGVASYPEDADTLGKLLAFADGALHDAKMAGRDRTISAANVRHDIYGLGNMIHDALRENRIVAAYQPIVDLRSGTVVAEEALARLVAPDGEIIAAGRFVPAASQLQLMHQVDLAVIIQAFSHCVAGLQSGRNRLAHFVNVSTDLLRHRELIDEMLAAAMVHCKECSNLIGDVKPIVIEITEHELLADISAARDLLSPFMDFGFRLALDDFGSGYSSYQYLADLPISFIKIDGLLTRRIAEKKVRAIIQGIQDTADQLGITTLAEFVEDAQTEAILKDVGVNWAQGYLYGHPVIPLGEADSATDQNHCPLHQDMAPHLTGN